MEDKNTELIPDEAEEQETSSATDAGGQREEQPAREGVYPQPEIEPTQEIYPQPSVDPYSGYRPGPQVERAQGFGHHGDMGPQPQFPPPQYVPPQYQGYSGRERVYSQPGMPPYQQPGMPPYQRGTGGDGYGTASMILGIISLLLACCIPVLPVFCAIVSIILAVIVLKSDRPGRGMAIAGLVCSIITCMIGAVFVAALLRSLFNGGFRFYSKGFDDFRDWF